VIGESTTLFGAPPDGSGDRAAPTRIGRFIILDRLGQGGMGTVFSAYDPELDRKVAVKVLRTASSDAAASARMQREARAMARLSDPHVVAVYDVGTHEGQTFIAMELVKGRTLRDWLAERTRSCREVVEMFVQAGRGLSAAHAAGIVHRDFKPDNVLVDGRDRARVTDFGLARPHAAAVAMDTRTTAVPSTTSNDALTEHGAVVGTPAYMAPEQLLESTADERSDQFGFCVALWEALYGERPFRADNLVDLAAQLKSGELQDPHKGVGVPSAWHRALRRGLAREPAGRWPSMDALVEALAKDPTRARRRTATLAAAAVLGVGGLAWHRVDLARKTDACEEAGAVIEHAWSDAKRTPLHEALAGTGVGNAEATWARLEPRLDEYASQWKRDRADACIETEVEGTREADSYGRMTDCLEEGRLALGKLVETLMSADAAAVQNAVTAAAALPLLAACKDEQWLVMRAPPPKDEATRQQTLEFRERLAEVHALASAGRYADALAQAALVVEGARMPSPSLLLAEAELAGGTVASLAGDYPRSAESLRAAHFEALRVGADVVAAEAALRLVDTVGYRLERHDDGLQWAEHARALLDRCKLDGNTLLGAALANNLGNVHLARGANDEALAHYEHALTARESLLGPEHPEAARAVENVGNAHFANGAYDEARAHFERALDIYQRTLGPEHPVVAGVFSNLGNVHLRRGDHGQALGSYEHALDIYESTLGLEHPDGAMLLGNFALAHVARGDYDEALAYAERALAIYLRLLGPDHTEVARALNQLGAIEAARGGYDEAQEHLERAVAILERRLGRGHPRVGDCIADLGNLHYARGAFDEAGAAFERALGIYERTLGADHPSFARVLDALGNARLARGDHDDALAQYERSLEIRERSLGPDHADLRYSLANIGMVHVERNRFEEAVGPLERALVLAESAPGRPADLAAIRFLLARALWETESDRARAHRLAELARDAWRDRGSAAAKELAGVDDWLGSRGR